MPDVALIQVCLLFSMARHIVWIYRQRLVRGCNEKMDTRLNSDMQCLFPTIVLHRQGRIITYFTQKLYPFSITNLCSLRPQEI